MDCPGITDLAVYQLGGVTDEERDAIDAHLVACTGCLKTYLAVKRASERAPLERPRPHVRARLRAEVARAFPPHERRSRLGLLRRRIPLYQGVALAALAAAVALAAPNVLRTTALSARPGTPAVDTARTHAESLHIY